ncbi:MAG: hypothetical protein ABSF59_21560 [Candidatus Sulfotelmatobacter sp.]
MAPLRRQILLRLLVLMILAAGAASGFDQGGPPHITNHLGTAGDLNGEIKIGYEPFL